MKRTSFSAIVIFILTLLFKTSSSQVSVSVNIGLQPEWGPVGYDYVDYYYIPEYEVYYYVPERKFIYLDGGKWIFATSLPRRFGTVDLFHTYKVVINEPKAYLHYDQHKVKYVKYKTVRDKQTIIRDSKDPKYVEARKHPGNNNAGNNNAKVAPAKNDSKASPDMNKTKAKTAPSNGKGKDDKKGKHEEAGSQPHK
jgi:hypothetical protein